MGDLGEFDPAKTMNLPINEHFFKIESMIEELIASVEETDKDVQILKGEFLAIGYENNQQNQETSLFVSDEAARLGKEKMKNQDSDMKDVTDIKQLLQKVNELKKIIIQEAAIVEHRVSEIESNVGFKYFFDPNVPSDEVN